jgi:hypothetical protein
VRGHIAKKGNRYYAVVYEGTDPGTGKNKYNWVAAGTRRSDAESLVNELVGRRLRGEEAGSDRSTLGAYLTDRWLPLQESRLRPSTFNSYRATIELHVLPYIGKLRLDKLQADDLEGLYVQLLRSGLRRGKNGGGLSATSVRYVHRVLSKALGDAHRKGIVTRNVATLMDDNKQKLWNVSSGWTWVINPSTVNQLTVKKISIDVAMFTRGIPKNHTLFFLSVATGVNCTRLRI